MIINEVRELVNYVADKKGRGYLSPAEFNLLAYSCQLEFLTSRLGAAKTPDAPFGYKSNRRVITDLRPFVYGPETIPLMPSGNFMYPYGFMWPDSWHKNDFSEITEIQSDEYPRLKHSVIHPPTEDYPVLIFRNPYGFVDPYSINEFQLSYVKTPSRPVWAYDIVNSEPVWNEANSTDFTLTEISFFEICMMILEKVGINLDKGQLVQYSQVKQQQGS
jgi:hypothetical protein